MRSKNLIVSMMLLLSVALLPACGSSHSVEKWIWAPAEKADSKK